MKKSSLQNQLQSVRKGSKLTFEYLIEIVAIVDALFNLGDIINNEDLVMYTLGGLGDEYEQFVPFVTS